MPYYVKASDNTFIKIIICFAFQESMKLMGMSVSMYWLSWFVFSLVYMVIACFIFTIFFCLKINSVGVFTYSQPTLIFVFFLVYAISLIAFSFMVSTFFQKGKNQTLINNFPL